MTLEVARVVARAGRALAAGAPSASTARSSGEPGTLSWVAVAGPVGGRAGPETLTLVSNTGGVEGGAAASDQVKAKLQAALGPLGGQGTVVATPKQELLEEAEAIGGEFGALFLFIGSFAIIAGVMLLVNVFVMLAEERKGELGMLRAVGLRRGRLIRGFVIEGTVYALVASALGLVAGLGVGRAVVEVTARIFASFATEGGPLLTFTASPTSLVNGFAAGFLIAFLTVALTSIRISRINIIAAIRDLPRGPAAPSSAAGWRCRAWPRPGSGRPRWSPSPAARASAPICTRPWPPPAVPAAGPGPGPRRGRLHRGVAGRARLGPGRQHRPARAVRRRLHGHLRGPRRWC